jgi:hypothetical protein
LRGMFFALTAMRVRFRMNADLAEVLARFTYLNHRELDTLLAAVKDCL